MRRSIALALMGLTACSTSAVVPVGDDLAVPPVDASTAPPPDLTPRPASPDLAGFPTLELAIGPVTLAPGVERTVCRTFRLPTQDAIDVLRIDATLLPGSHHLVIYKSNEAGERPTPYDCPPLDIGFGGGGTKAVPLYIAETEDDNGLPLPSGTAFHFPAGQMVKLEAHYLNASARPLEAKGVVTLTLARPGESSSYIAADIMFCGSVLELATTGVPRGMSSLAPGYFRPQDVVPGDKIFGLTAHQHRRGTLMTISRSSGASDEGSLLVKGQPWDHEPFITYDDDHLLTFGPQEGLRWQCHYDNPDNFVVKFGESAESDEMCFLWAYYFPSAGRFILQECLR